MTVDGRSSRRSVKEILPEALRLIELQGRVPPRYLFMRELKIGPRKADELMDLLDREELTERVRKDEKMNEVENEKDEKMNPEVETLEKMKTPVEVGEKKMTVAITRPTEVPIDSHKITSFEDEKDEKMNEVENLLAQKDEKMTRPVKQGMSLTKLRWMLRFVLVLGVAVSISGNILDADSGHPVSQAIKAWSPLALLIVIECISLVPVHTTMLMVARRVATTGIALIAAWVSYWHMVSVCQKYGETGGSEYLIPLSVDGLVVVATICLVEISGQINAARRMS